MSEGVVVLQGWARVGEGRPAGDLCVFSQLFCSQHLFNTCGSRHVRRGPQRLARSHVALRATWPAQPLPVLFRFHLSSQDVWKPQRVWATGVVALPPILSRFLEASASMALG